MLHIDMAKGARTLVEQCVGVRPGENVLIVTDSGRDLSIAVSLAAAVEAAGGKSAIIVTRPLARAGEEPLPPVAGAMAAADVVISPTTRAIFHTRTVKEIRSQRRVRFFALSEAEPRTLMSGPFDADFMRQKPLVNALATRMSTGKCVRITSPGGVDLTADIHGRPPRGSNGMCRNPGESASASIEVYIAPIEDSVNGVFVCDASCSMIGLVAEPIRIEFCKGRAVSITGRTEAGRLRELLDGVGSPEAYRFAEIGFGLNPASNIRGTIIEDEGKYGTGHVALGNNAGFGGTNSVPIHVDMVYWKPSVWIDGEQVYRDGELLLTPVE